MAQVRTVDFLPEIFQTPVNKQFLSATLDQLVQEPSFVKTQGYVGQKVGPGVNPNDSYVVEPTKSRTDYQLEPGVVLKKPNNTPWYSLSDSDIADVITFPGINDAIKLQGGVTNNSDRLYNSEYYCWDPFVDFDKLVNYNQYYWLPSGPLAVDVYASKLAVQDTFEVIRENGVYKFSGVDGDNPSLTLVRGGNYTFNVAQNDKLTVNYRVTNKNDSEFLIDYQPNPTLTLVRGNTYIFNMVTDGVYPFYIKTKISLGTADAYNNGVTRNGASKGLITFVVPQDAPDTLYYISENDYSMQGIFNIVNAIPGTGPGFWIQAAPGVSGKMPATPNISSRDVLGVVNNGEDLGSVIFNVPYKNAQDFYYNLTDEGSVDLINTEIPFDQINNIFVDQFLEQYPDGIDGITNLDGRTIIFTGSKDAQIGGWFDVSQFDPIVRTTPPYVSESVSYDYNPYDIQPYETIDNIIVSGQPDPLDGAVGSFDQSGYALSTPIDNKEIRYSLWVANYITSTDGRQYISLTSKKLIPNLSKLYARFGTQWSSTQWYKNAEGYYQEVPLLTATLDTIYYQDGVDPEMFGHFDLIDQSENATLFIKDIIGQPNYTSPNGVVFTNGLKVMFSGNVVPQSYANNSYYVEGVGSAIQLLPVVNFVTPETYTQSLSTPYDTTPYDIGSFDETLNAPLVPDYLTINRDSPDLNPWSRSNRWFHISIIEATAGYNNLPLDIDNAFRAHRPILEFRGGIKLINFGTEGKSAVNIIDLTQTDAFSNVEGKTSYIIDGYPLANGSRVIFGADLDENVRNKIYVVEFITPDTIPPLIAEPIINLVEATDGLVLPNDDVVCLSGATLQGISFYFDGLIWARTQQKTSVNQAPLFDIFDTNGISFSDLVTYPSTTFNGTKLFSYALGTGPLDPILKFPLAYQTLNNIGDIVFDNNLYKDTFVYVINSQGQTVPISEGFVYEYSDRTTYVKEIGWQTAATPSIDRQQFQFKYDGSPLVLDVKVDINQVVPAVQVWIGAVFQDPSNYTIATTDTTTTITFVNAYEIGSLIEILVISSQVSDTAFYEVPINLENNPLNQNFDRVSLGTVRSHYQTIAENLIKLRGQIDGSNNTRDLGNIVPYGLQILQQSSPLTVAGFFMRDSQYDIFTSIEYNNREYTKFKGKLLETVVRNEYDNMSIAQILDSALADVTLGRTSINPFYWSDMLPHGPVFNETAYVVSAITTNVFNTKQTYNFTSSNYLGLLVYLETIIDGVSTTILLERDVEYVVSSDGPTITILIPLVIGDVIVINEYSNTVGSFVPNTPTKMGLYPKYIPIIYYDTNYVEPTLVIRGHDGSITMAFGDIRDQVLLEFEKRIFNNIKMDDNPIPLSYYDVVPGFFRKTQYSIEEINQILSYDFLNWVGGNKLDYKTQDFIVNNPFTFNYSDASSKLNSKFQLTNIGGELIPGAWRGIYEYFYDTESPNTRPWEMLGFSEMPSYWEGRYGPAPYTCNNLVLWDDLANGYIADPSNPHYDLRFVRPNLQSVIPVDSEGNLLPPIDSVVGEYDPTTFKKSWTVNDGSPTESAWWTSSSFPFSVMRLLAVSKPAEFFSLFIDRDLYKYNTDLNQYLYNNRYRLDANNLQVYGDGTSKASYMNWIVDYNQQSGVNSSFDLSTALGNLDVRLCYRMASYTGKNYFQIYIDKPSPESNNLGLLLPDESYDLMLYKNQPFDYIDYSAVMIEKVPEGYSVYGFNNMVAYFPIFVSSTNGTLTTITVGDTTIRVPNQYTDNIVQVPYGYVFTNATVVVDFLLSYGKYLESKGLVFDDVENGYVLNWQQMANEFLYFSQQGWSSGTVINLNPSARKLTATQPGSVIDLVANVNPTNIILDQNKKEIKVRDMVVNRFGNLFTMEPSNAQSICFVRLKYVSYEDIIVLNNISVFNDLIYDPISAARQQRVRVVGWVTDNWDGTINAPGFILNQPNVYNWKPNIKYTKGAIVFYKNSFWSALDIIQPKETFDYADWAISNYSMLEQGFLPNIPNKANQLANSYDINNANLERDTDLLSYGLTGFRPRKYMEALNLDDVSQVGVYLNFLKTKGTTQATKVFNRADLGRETGDYDVFENWGVLISTYGANANRRFFELRLNQALLTSNPSTVQIINSQQKSDANQPILLSDIWRSSYPYTSPNIFPTVYTNFHNESALPNAGYVDLNDVDLTVFNINEPASLAENISTIGIGTTIWAAKTNGYDWSVYRCEEVPGRITKVTDNLNGTSIITFSKTNNLVVGDLVIIRFVSNSLDGVYRVLGVPAINQIIIEFEFTSTNQTSLMNTNGLAFYLQTARVKQASDVASLTYSNLLIPNAKVWVDNDGTGKWEVLQKTNQFIEDDTTLLPDSQVENSLFGYDVAQSQDNFTVLIGAPGPIGTGSVTPYFKNPNGNYFTRDAITLNATDTTGFGEAISIGNKNWCIVGASASDNNSGYALAMQLIQSEQVYDKIQLLISPDHASGGQFGKSIAISNDELWMVVGSPGIDSAYLYNRIDNSEQSVTYVTDGFENVYEFNSYMITDLNEPEQIQVILNKQLLTYNIDYIVNNTTIVLAYTPIANQELIILRRTIVGIGRTDYYNIVATGGTGTDASFVVTNLYGEYVVDIERTGLGFMVGDVLTILGTQIGGTSPTNDIEITVEDVSITGEIEGITYVGTAVAGGVTYSLTPYLYTATNIESFIVTVNGTIQRPIYDYTFDPIDNSITLITVPSIGSSIIVKAESYWKYIGTMVGEVGSGFGSAVSITTDGQVISVGSPVETVTYDDIGALQTGSTRIFNRGVVNLTVTDSSDYQYTIPNTPIEPITVMLNGEYLTNTSMVPNGQYTIIGSTLTINSSVVLTIGDTISINTNQLNEIQFVTPNAPSDEAQFGFSLATASNNCDLYIGEPYEGSDYVQAGAVERFVDQSRVYGTITTTIANPILIGGSTIRINNYEVAVPYYPNNNIQGLIDSINGANIPNAFALATPNLVFAGTGTTTTYYVGSIYSNASSYTPMVTVDDIEQIENIDYTYDNTTQKIIFVDAPNTDSVIVVVSGRMVISVKNYDASTVFNRLSVSPGLDGQGAFYALGIDTFAWTQTIRSPVQNVYTWFGYSISVGNNNTSLIISAPHGNVYEPLLLDNGKTYFDSHSTTFFDPINDSGVVYTFDYLGSINESINNPGQYVFGQQIYDVGLVADDKFGLSVDYTGTQLLVSAPYHTNGEGVVYNYTNLTNSPAWVPIRVQQPVVDVNLLVGAFMYDVTLSEAQNYFDFIDPLQGKVLGVASRNIDYVGAVDPAYYNIGPIHNIGTSWGEEHVGKIWWDTDTVRFLNPHQNDLSYASKQWGNIFPGSSVDIYQWISSSTPPTQYVGSGVPLSTLTYTKDVVLNKQNILETRYYFWVRGLDTVDTQGGKTLSINAISRYIENPRASGIPYISVIDASTISIYNGNDFVSAQNTILHIIYDQKLSNANVHTQYELITDGDPKSFLNDTLYRKLQDSFCGVDTRGGIVPDPLLNPAERYGVQFRPRQSMFIDRFKALENYLGSANEILLQYPITESRSFPLLNSKDPEPPSSAAVNGQVIVFWNKKVANIQELGYQDLTIIPSGYKYLVESDVNYGGGWTIYQVVANGFTKSLQLETLQTYNTTNYWNYTNWYEIGYNPSTKIIASVPNFSALSTLTLATAPIGSSVQVEANSVGKYEIYIRISQNEWNRVGLENGTIQFSAVLWNYSLGNFGWDVEVFDAQYFDEYPSIETRKIIQSINEELFVDDMAIYKNQLLILMFNYIYTEFYAPTWLTKTSLIDVDHRIRALLQYQIYEPDDQTFVLDYINEVKPYHVHIREFNLIYNGDDIYPGALTDFDCPAYYDTNLAIPQFVSPILTPYTQATTPVRSELSDTPSDSTIWSSTPWKYWFNNYLLGIQGVNVTKQGYGYTVAPQVIVSGDCIEQAVMTAIINSAGHVVGVNIINAGSGYSTTAIVTFVGGNGYGAEAAAIMGNDLVRSIRTTIKYDRCEYAANLVPWEPNVPYYNGTMVRHVDRVWEANNTSGDFVEGSVFDPAEWKIIDPSDLSGADRTMGLYVPTSNIPGISLPLLMSGIDYPGVEVFGSPFVPNISQGFDTTGFDEAVSNNTVGSFDYSPTSLELDVIYSSSYLDIDLGSRPTSVNVDGGAYISEFASHAPEELVPGIEFDTMDLRVYTRVGADWIGRGHGFGEETLCVDVTQLPCVVDFSNLIKYGVSVIVSNVTSGLVLTSDINYTIDWVTSTITINEGISINDVVAVSVYNLGGGNQLYRATYNGTEVGNTVIIPVNYNDIFEVALFINGVVDTNYQFTRYDDRQTEITLLGSPLTINETLTLVAIGPTTVGDNTVNYSWSTPQTQVILAQTGTTQYTLDNSLMYTNPVNLIVDVNGIRSRTAAGKEYIGDGSAVSYYLPDRLGFQSDLITLGDVSVYINGILQVGIVDYVLNPATSYGRTITFNRAPSIGDKILVAVKTGTACYVYGNDLVFDPNVTSIPVAGDVITVTTWNDTREQDLVTQVFVGPISTTTEVIEGYDSTVFDPVPRSNTLNGTPGTFDYSSEVGVITNSLVLDRLVTDSSRLWVTLNGIRLFPNYDFTLGQTVVGSVPTSEIILNNRLNTSDIVMVTLTTQFVVPNEMAFRIFQNMRGVQATYRITESSTTNTINEVMPTDDIIYVDDASKLSEPNLDINVWGVVSINGERIMYRNRDTVTNSISGLIRGTSGTASASHVSGSFVYDFGIGNLMPEQFQNYVVVDTVLADGEETTFVASNIIVSSELENAIQVYIGGILQPVDAYTIIDLNPVTIVIGTPTTPIAPPSGVEVSIAIRRGVTWYNPGADTPSNGVSLQETDNYAARFLRGEI